jgi:ferrochelatase
MLKPLSHQILRTTPFFSKHTRANVFLKNKTGLLSISPSYIPPSATFASGKESNSDHGKSTKDGSQPKTGIVLLNMGGPSTQEEVADFLMRLFNDKEIIPLPFQNILGSSIAKLRTTRVKKLYHEIGGGTNYFETGRLMLLFF